MISYDRVRHSSRGGRGARPWRSIPRVCGRSARNPIPADLPATLLCGIIAMARATREGHARLVSPRTAFGDDNQGNGGCTAYPLRVLEGSCLLRSTSPNTNAYKVTMWVRSRRNSNENLSPLYINRKKRATPDTSCSDHPDSDTNDPEPEGKGKAMHNRASSRCSTRERFSDSLENCRKLLLGRCVVVGTAALLVACTLSNVPRRCGPPSPTNIIPVVRVRLCYMT